MDRKTIIAITLAMLVLTAYQSIFVAPKKAQALKETQILEAKQVTEKQVSPVLVTVGKVEITTPTSTKEKITILKTTAMSVEFSNMGGSLHKIVYDSKEKVFPLENMLTLKGYEQVPFSLISNNDTGVVYGYSDSERRIVKSFDIADQQSIKAKIQITSLKDVSRLEEVGFTTINIHAQAADSKNSRNTMLDELSILENGKVVRKGNAFKFNPKDNKTVNAQIGWVGYREHYHAFLIKPEFETKSAENKQVSESQLAVIVYPKEGKLESVKTVEYNFTIVAGNQDINWLKSYKKDFEKIVAFSGFWLLDIIAKAVYFTIPVVHAVCRSWGLSIILVSLIIYGITYPLTMKSMSSMRKMQLVQPKVAALQKRYKGDPQKLNTEMVALYKTEGVNPLGGCLPFLLQMPVFMGLYQVLWRSYYFQGKSFLWIKDLALPDRLFILPFDLPFLGNEFNILPIVMAGVMFLQQSVSSKNMVVTDEQQAMQQKMMKYIFPFFIGFIFYKFASGLSLYFTVFYALSTWTQWKIANTGVMAPAKIK